MTHQLKGIVHQVDAPQQINEKLTKRVLVIKTEEQYPQLVAFETINKPELFDGYNSGDTVNVSFNIRGREWENRYFVSLHAWKIERQSSTTPPAQPSAQGYTPPLEKDDNDVPF